MTRVVDLPESIVRYLGSFISNDDYRYFLNTSTEFFGAVRRQSIYFSLNPVSSTWYVTQQGFQELLLSKVENGWKQIGLNFRRNLPAIPPCLPVHKIVCKTGAITVEQIAGLNIEVVALQNVREIPMIPHLRELKISKSTTLSDVSNLSHLSKLTIIDGYDVRDIKSLENIPELWLEGCPLVRDYSMLNASKQKMLYLKNCPNLVNVNNFAGIRILELSHCDNLVDVSPLYGIYDLSISHCRKVTDISGLGGHHRLCLRFLNSDVLTGTESLRNIPHVELTYLPIDDIDELEFAKSVKLFSCYEIVDVSPLKSAKSVVLDEASKIKDLTPLKDVPELEIIAQTLLIRANLNKLRNHSLKLIDCQFKDVKTSNGFRHFQHLRIFNNKTIVHLIDEGKIDGFLSLQSLELEFCEQLTHVDGLGNIPTIKIITCKNLTDISGLGANRYVELRSCNGLVDVTPLASVPIVTIVECDKVQDYQCLANVQRLKVIR